MDRDVARQELTETAHLLLAAMAAEDRLVRLGSSASLEEAEQVRCEAERLHGIALARRCAAGSPAA